MIENNNNNNDNNDDDDDNNSATMLINIVSLTAHGFQYIPLVAVDLSTVYCRDTSALVMLLVSICIVASVGGDPIVPVTTHSILVLLESVSLCVMEWKSYR